MQMKGKVNVNDDAGLEKEADVMGAKALFSERNTDTLLTAKSGFPRVFQNVDEDIESKEADKTKEEAEKAENPEALTPPPIPPKPDKQLVETYKAAMAEFASASAACGGYLKKGDDLDKSLANSKKYRKIGVGLGMVKVAASVASLSVELASAGTLKAISEFIDTGGGVLGMVRAGVNVKFDSELKKANALDAPPIPPRKKGLAAKMRQEDPNHKMKKEAVEWGAEAGVDKYADWATEKTEDLSVTDTAATSASDMKGLNSFLNISVPILKSLKIIMLDVPNIYHTYQKQGHQIGDTGIDLTKKWVGGLSAQYSSLAGTLDYLKGEELSELKKQIENILAKLSNTIKELSLLATKFQTMRESIKLEEKAKKGDYSGISSDQPPPRPPRAKTGDYSGKSSGEVRGDYSGTGSK
jgi:hypothetical protein